MIWAYNGIWIFITIFYYIILKLRFAFSTEKGTINVSWFVNKLTHSNSGSSKAQIQTNEEICLSFFYYKSLKKYFLCIFYFAVINHIDSNKAAIQISELYSRFPYDFTIFYIFILCISTETGFFFQFDPNQNIPIMYICILYIIYSTLK